MYLIGQSRMVSRADGPERDLRKRIYTLRNSCTPPMSWGSIADVLINGADGGPNVKAFASLKDPRSTIRYKCRAYEKDLEEQLKLNVSLATAQAISSKAALPVPVGDLGSADVEADLVLATLKEQLNKQTGTEFDNGVVVSALAGTMFKYIQRKDIREKGAGGALAMKEVIQAVIVCIQEEDHGFQERFVARLYNRLGEDIQRYIRIPGPGSG